MIAVFAFFVVASLNVALQDTPAQQPIATAEDVADDRADFDDLIFQGGFRAGAEVRYQNAMVIHYSSYISGWSWWASFLTISGLLGTLIFGNMDVVKPDWGKKYHKKAWLSTVMLVVGFVGFFAGNKTGDTAASKQLLDHAVLEKEWSTLRSEWEKLDLQQKTLPIAELRSQILSLKTHEATRQHAEPTDTDETLWDKCWVTEAQVRGLEVPEKPTGTAPTMGQRPDVQRS